MGTVGRLARAHSRVLGQRVQAAARVRKATGKTRRSRGWEAAHAERWGDPPWSSEARRAKPERPRQAGLRSLLR